MPPGTDHDRYIGVDVGGTKIAAGIVGFPNGTIHARRQLDTNATRGGEPVLADVRRVVDDLVAEASAARFVVRGIGLGLCEIIDSSGNIASANSIPWATARVHQCLGSIAPLKIEADVRAAARAEALLGGGRGCRQFLYLTVGTGISSCLVQDGRPFTGARGATGTIGSGPLPSSVASHLGTGSCSLEEFAAGPALVRRFRGLGGQVDSARDVMVAAESGHSGAIEIVRSAGTTLGVMVGLLVNTLDPERVIIGGGLGLSGGLYWDSMLAAVRRSIWWGGHRALPVVPAGLGLDAGLIGAAATAWQAGAINPAGPDIS